VIDDATKEEVESIFNEFILAEDALHAAVAEQLLEEVIISVSTEVGCEQIESAILESAAGKCKCADMVKDELAACYSKIKKLSDEIVILKQHVCLVVPFNEQSLVGDTCVQFYTGLPNLHIVKAVFDQVHKNNARRKSHQAVFLSRIYVCLLKLRLNSPLQDLAYRF